VFRARARHYSSAREHSLFADNVPATVYDNLIATVRSRLDTLHEYFELRRRVLNLSEIHQYDTYVPLVSEVQTNITFDEAIAMVLTALRPLGAEYVDTLRAGLHGRWCDRYES